MEYQKPLNMISLSIPNSIVSIDVATVVYGIFLYLESTEDQQEKYKDLHLYENSNINKLHNETY